MKKILIGVALAVAAPIAFGVAAPAAHAQEKEGYQIPTPPEGIGQIIFYRTSAFGGAALGCAVFNSGEEDKLSSLGVGRYFVLHSEPGERNFSVKSLETKDALTLEVEEGETQFVRCKIKAGFLSGRANIAPSSEKEFRRKYKKPKLVDGDDMTQSVQMMNYGTAEDAETE